MTRRKRRSSRAPGRGPSAGRCLRELRHTCPPTRRLLLGRSAQGNGSSQPPGSRHTAAHTASAGQRRPRHESRARRGVSECRRSAECSASGDEPRPADARALDGPRGRHAAWTAPVPNAADPAIPLAPHSRMTEPQRWRAVWRPRRGRCRQEGGCGYTGGRGGGRRPGRRQQRHTGPHGVTGHSRTPWAGPSSDARETQRPGGGAHARAEGRLRLPVHGQLLRHKKAF